jgi:hypothetical protein
LGNSGLLLVVVLAAGFFFAVETGWLEQFKGDDPEPTPYPTYTPIPTHTATPSPTSTSTPFPTSTPFHSSNKINGVWCYGNTLLNTAFFESMVNLKIKNVFWQCVRVNSDNSLTQTVDDSTISNSVSIGKSYGVNVWLWVGTYPHNVFGEVDISTVEKRNIYINNILGIAEKGFYGVQEDSEDFTSSSLTNGQHDIRYVWFCNNLSMVLHNHGLKLMVYAPAVWSNFNTQCVPYFQGIDFLFVACRYDSFSHFKNDIEQFTSNTALPVLFGVGYGVSVASDVEWINSLTLPSNLKGFNVYCYADMDFFDWNTWDNWNLKN